MIVKIQKNNCGSKDLSFELSSVFVAQSSLCAFSKHPSSYTLHPLPNSDNSPQFNSYLDAMTQRVFSAGTAGSFLKRVQIYSQDASILGWTCGNLIAPAGSAAEPKQWIGGMGPDS